MLRQHLRDTNKMHLFFYLRGIEPHISIFKSFISTQFFKWRRKNLTTGEIEEHLVQGSLRPSFLGAWEYVFPEEALADIISIFARNERDIGAEKTLKNIIRNYGLKKIFGLEDIPHEIWEKAKTIPDLIYVNSTERGFANSFSKNVTLHILGIKKDLRQVAKQFGFEQEML